MSTTYLEKLIRQEETEQKIDKRNRKREQQREYETAQRDVRIEDKFRNEKTKLAQKVFDWVKDFSASKVGKRLQGVSRDPRGVKIFGDGWGHQVPHYEGFGVWSSVHVTPKGDLCYFAGFKWAGGAERRLASSAELAGYLNYHYLSELCGAIETEKVYNNIQKWHFGK
ncbi:MAG: hypothetical protein AABX75_02195 [Nanoarchaeota archaeon]